MKTVRVKKLEDRLEQEHQQRVVDALKGKKLGATKPKVVKKPAKAAKKK